jgi:glycosyltransferase involved in cell wall biosynthesis
VRIVAHHGARLWGGAERAVVRLLAGLQGRGHEVLLLYNDELVGEGARSAGLAAERLPLGGDIALPHAVRLARALRRRAPDVLLISFFKKAWLGGLAGRLAGVPRVVLRTALSTDLARGVKYRIALRWIDAVVLNSPSMRAPFLATAPAYPPERVRVVPGAVPTPDRARGGPAVREELGITPVAPLVGAIARLDRQKRLDRLLEAMTGLEPHVHALVAGEGPEGEALSRLARELGLEKRVHFLGLREDVGDLLDAIDVFVLCSDREGLSNAMLEALALGVPVVATRVSGAGEALAPFPDGPAPGELVGFDASELAGALRRLLEDPERRRIASQAALRRSRESFDFERLLDDWEAVLAGEAP